MYMCFGVIIIINTYCVMKLPLLCAFQIKTAWMDAFYGLSINLGNVTNDNVRMCHLDSHLGFFLTTMINIDVSIHVLK